MKLYLNSNLAEGTPEELVEYKELLKERGLDSEKSLFHFGHEHQLTEEEKQDTFQGLLGSLKLDKSSIGSSESSTDEAEENVEEDSMHDEGAFYTVTEEARDSLLPVGAILQHLQGNLFIDSKGQQCIISRPSFVDRGNANELDDNIKQDRFELAKQLGIQLTDTTDLAQATEGKHFKVTVGYPDLVVGDLVTITDDNDGDNQPQCKDKYGNFSYVYLHHLELVEDNLESTESSTDEAQTPSRELKVGNRVKVLNSLGGAVGEATVSAVLEGGRVELAGNNKEGSYLSDWSNYISNVEKIEKPASFGAIQAKAYLEDKSIEQVVEEEKGNYKEEEEPNLEQYFEIIDNGVFRTDIKRGTILKKIAEKCDLYKNYSTSDGITQACSYPEYDLKQVEAHTFKDRFEFAEKAGIRLMTDTDFAEECKGHQFEVTDSDYLTNFEGDEVLTVFADDGSEAISFENQDEDVQFALLKHVREIARPTE